MSLLASRLSGLVASALAQHADGLGLTEIARAVGGRPSSVQRALDLLIEAGVVTRRDRPRPRFSLTETPAIEPLLALVSAITPTKEVVQAVVRANPGVEFASLDHDGVLLVTTWNVSNGAQSRLHRAIARLSSPVTLLEHHDLRERLPDEPSLGERAAAGTILKGSLARSFPDRTRHGDPSAPCLHDLNPQVRRPSQRAITDLSRRFGLHRLAVFGSAVRTDLRPDSDVDVLIEPRPGVRLGLSEHVALRMRLEALFERDVDVVNARFASPELLARAEQDAVVLHGRA